MKAKAFTSIAVVVTLHVAALGSVLGPWHGQYLLVAVGSGAVIWSVFYIMTHNLDLLIGGYVPITNDNDCSWPSRYLLTLFAPATPGLDRI